MNGLNIKQLLSSKGKLIGSIVVILVIIIMCIILLLPKHLQGKYSHTTDMFLVTSTDTLRFDGIRLLSTQTAVKLILVLINYLVKN